MIQRLIALIPMLAICLWAADFWKEKPYTEWSQKEIEKMVTDSPWGDRFSVKTGQKGRIDPGASAGPTSRVRGAVGKGDPVVVGELTVPVVLSWYSALPIKQAVVLLQLGSEAESSPQAQAFLNREEEFYILRVTGLPGSARRTIADEGVEKILAESTLKTKRKDREPLHPMQLQDPAAASARKGKGAAPVDLYFLFSREETFDIDQDKELEFQTKIGPISVKRSFKLKDMVFEGKLEL